MIAKQLITSHVVPVEISDTGAFALLQMEEARLSHLPVVDGAGFIGLITDKSILAAEDPEKEIGGNNYTLINAAVTEQQHLYEVIRIFSTLNLSLLPVVSEKNKYLGAIVLSTVVHALAELVGLHEPGGIIVLEINDKDYSLAEIVDVVESNDAKILSCFVTSLRDSTKLEVTIKLNRMEIGPQLHAFARLNYFVTSSWSKEDSYSEGLKDRFDALMNYLSI